MVTSMGSRCSAHCNASERSVLHQICCIRYGYIKKNCKSIINIKRLKYHLWGGANVTYILRFYCQFNVKSICVQINRLETDKQSDPKGCAAHAIYRLEARWASFYANTMFAMEQSVLLLKIRLMV